MQDKPILYSLKTTPDTVLPKESLDDFKNWILNDGLKPSQALRKMMKKYNCPNPDPGVPIQYVSLTYNNLDLGRTGLRFKIIDSAYPNSVPEQFSDDDFDKGVEELLALPPGW